MLDLSRRGFLALLLLGTRALAGEDEKEGEKKKKKKKEQGERILYAEVSFIGRETVSLGSGRLATSSPWAAFLAPGMWIRAQGEWRGEVFHARRLEIVYPPLFSYYLGPAKPLGLGEGWLEVWHTGEGETQPFALRFVPPKGEALLLVPSHGGRPIALPPGLPPPQTRILGSGWFLLKGEVWEDLPHWKTIRPFP